MAAASRPSNPEWMLPHPSLVFKSFEDPLAKSPFPFTNTSHIAPEKITESYVDQNGVRCYRVKWCDSWLTEQHVSTVFPQLITEYWISKPINETGTENQTNTTRGNVLTTQLQETPLSVPKNSSSSIGKTTPEVTGALQHISATPSTTMAIPQLFNNEQQKEQGGQQTSGIQGNEKEQGVEETPVDQQQSQEQQSQDQQQQQNQEGEANNKSTNDFTVGESLTLPEKLQSEDGQKTEIAKQNDDIILLIDKQTNNIIELQKHSDIPKDKEQTDLDNTKPIPNAVLSAAFESQLQQYVNQIVNHPMTAIEHMHHQTLAAQIQQAVNEQKQKSKKSSKQSKSSTPKDKQPVDCDICGKTISSRKNLRVHKTVKHFKNGNFPCEICGRKFALSRDLKRHMPLHTNERNYVCEYCGLQCKQPGHLTKHLRTHTEVMNWRCDCCFKNFRVQADLKEHCFTEHADIKDKNLTCTVCKEKLKLPNSVYLHSLRHSGVREYECHICKASFKLKQHMQVHLKTHDKTSEKEKHPCDICGKEFRSKHRCVNHRQKHTESTPEEYLENQRQKANFKKPRQSKKRKDKKKGEGEGQDEGNADSDDSLLDSYDSDLDSNLPKRKRRKPTKVLFADGEDMQTKKLIRKKFDKKDYNCTHCEDSFRSQALLNSHLKLHTLEAAATATIRASLESHPNDHHLPHHRDNSGQSIHRGSMNDMSDYTMSKIMHDTHDDTSSGSMLPKPNNNQPSAQHPHPSHLSESQMRMYDAQSMHGPPQIHKVVGGDSLAQNNPHHQSSSSTADFNINPLAGMSTMASSITPSSVIESTGSPPQSSYSGIPQNDSHGQHGYRGISPSSSGVNPGMLPPFTNVRYSQNFIPFMNISRLVHPQRPGNPDQSIVQNMGLMPDNHNMPHQRKDDR